MLSIRLNGWQQTTLVSNGLVWNGSYIEWNLSESTALNKTKLTCTCIWHGLPYENGLHHHNFAKCRRILHEISAAKFLIMHWGQRQQRQWYTALSTTIYSLIKAQYNSAPKSTHRVSHRQNFIKKIESDFIEILLNSGGIITPCTHMTKKCPGFSTTSEACLLFKFRRAEAKHRRA